MNDVGVSATLATEDSHSTPAATPATQYQDERLPLSTRRARVNFQKDAFHQLQRSLKNFTEMPTISGCFLIKVLERPRRCRIELSPHCGSALVLLVSRDFRCSGTMSSDEFRYSP